MSMAFSNWKVSEKKLAYMEKRHQTHTVYLHKHTVI